MRQKSWLLLLAGLLAGCSAPSGNELRFPYEWLDVQGYGGNIDGGEILEPSGISFHPGRRTLFAVSDEGELIELQTDGVILARYSIPGDLEGITVHPGSGMVYVLVEAEEIIHEVDPDTGEVQRTFRIDRAYGGDPNFLQKQETGFDNGCEAIAFVPEANHPEGGYFMVSNQWDPPCIMKVEVPLKTGSGRDPTARITNVLPVRLDDPAAMYYDADTGLLNVVSDADNILLEVTLEGRVVRQYAFLGDNQEGLARDPDGFLYIAQDSGGIIKVRDLRNHKAADRD